MTEGLVKEYERMRRALGVISRAVRELEKVKNPHAPIPYASTYSQEVYKAGWLAALKALRERAGGLSEFEGL